MSAAYRILDEPAGTRGSALVFNPFWPLLGMMLAGAWLGVVMFGINALTLRSQTWRRELALAASIPIGSLVLTFLILVALNTGVLAESAIPYAVLVIVVWKLAIGYWLFFLQQSGYALFEYFGGGARGQALQLGAALVVVGAIIRSRVVQLLPGDYWQMMVG